MTRGPGAATSRSIRLRRPLSRTGSSASVSAVIRIGEAADIEECAALARIAAPERTANDLAEGLLRDVEHPEHQLIVAATDEAIVGYGRARLFEPTPGAPAETAPRGYYLTGVFVRSDRRRCGIATAITEARLDWISERSADAWFFANARNNASIELHRRLGFEEITRHFFFPGLTFEGGEGILFRLRMHARA
jgi:ribosomal protein S18 acetylase RimI-like enzyme